MELGGKVPRMHQKGDREIKDVLLERYGLEERLKSLYSQLSCGCSSFKIVKKPLETNRGRSPASHLQVESMHAFLVSGLVDRLSRLGSAEGAAYCVNLG